MSLFSRIIKWCGLHNQNNIYPELVENKHPLFFFNSQNLQRERVNGPYLFSMHLHIGISLYENVQTMWIKQMHFNKLSVWNSMSDETCMSHCVCVVYCYHYSNRHALVSSILSYISKFVCGPSSKKDKMLEFQVFRVLQHDTRSCSLFIIIK